MELSFDLVHSPAGEFHQGKEEGLVVGIFVKAACVVLKVLRIDFMQQLIPVGTQLAELLINRAIKIAFLLLLCILGSEPLLKPMKLMVNI